MNATLNLDLNSASKLVALLIEFYQKKQDGNEIDFSSMATEMAKVFGIDDLDAFLKDSLQGGLADVFDDQSAEKIATVIVGMYKPIAQLIVDYAQGNMDPAKLLENLNQIYLNNTADLMTALQHSAGFELPEGVNGFLGKYALTIVAVYCFAATYKIYRKAAADAQLAHEQRIEIERLCQESMAQLKKYRAEMETLFDTYMLDRLEPFSVSILAMDKAIVEDDADGFIGANDELWQLLGREGQYHNAKEFDDLMFSDVSFKL